MLPADDKGLDRGSAVKRWGPLAIIAVLLLVVGVVVVTRSGDSSGSGAAQPATEAKNVSWTTPGKAGAPAPTGKMPVTYAEAKASGDAAKLHWSSTCDTETGRVKMPSVFALPCVPAFSGDNGGATSQGVTAGSIKVVFYAPDVSNDLQSILGGFGANDTAEQRTQTLQDYLEIYGSVAETYGRKLDVVRFKATGAADDVVAARADAADIIAMKPFAVVGGPGLDRGTFAQALTEAKIMCFDCGAYLPDNMVMKMAPYAWSPDPSPDQTLDLLSTWTKANDANSANADYAGGDLKGKPRKVGDIHFEQDPPIYGATAKARPDLMKAVALDRSYLFDLPTLPAKAADLIAQFKANKITTIVFLGDPIMPIYLTKAAEQQNYHPEWIFTGTALTDTNVLARQYDQDQMAHAFGISQLPAPTDQSLQESIRLYRWYFGDPSAMPPAKNQYALLAPPAQWLFAGIHMAGPDLTPATFARGMFRLPPTGGGPANPLVSYGNWGYYKAMDYGGIDDAVQIWWDPTVNVKDERGAPGKGAWRRTDEGSRFTTKAPPKAEDRDPATAITVLDSLQGPDKPKDYPPPPGSPAAASG